MPVLPKLDKKDYILLDVLQTNGRASLTELAKALHLSIDSTHKRLKKLHESGVIARFGIFIDPKMLGYDIVANISIKLSNISEEELEDFIRFLINHKNTIEVMTTLGEYDMTLVIIAKNTEEFETVSRFIRHKFKNIIADWRSVINLKIYKFEEYRF